MDKAFDEKYYAGLGDNGAWQIFVARPDQATAEVTGYFAVSAGYESKGELEEAIASLPVAF